MNYKQLREDLIEYYGSAMMGGSPMAVIELIDIEHASDRELIKLSKQAGFNLEKYDGGKEHDRLE
ncbi:MAG: hypothetical protein ABRQ24_01780 [Syntrophomonadaceae bacterium]